MVFILNNRTPVRSYEYKNDFLYVVIREAPEHGRDAYVYCCGVNLSRFCPLSWRKAGICSHPAIRGLQLLRTHVSAFTLKKGMTAKKAEGVSCDAMTPRGQGWYHENPLLIEHGSPEGVREVLEFSVMDLVKTVLVVCVPDERIPAGLPDPAAMQKFLESLSVAEERRRATAYDPK